jgi:Fe-S-cluster containining protein
MKSDELSSFFCRQCGACCRWGGHVLLTETDITRLAAAAGLPEGEWINRYTALAANRRQLTLADGPDGACILLQGDRCSFYEARPEQCRAFPHGWRVQEGCPGLDALTRPQTDAV